MVFLFPGVLFRRVFFSGRFSQNFDSGNTLERILYSLLISIICLFLFSIFAIQIDYLLGGHVKVFSVFTESELFVNFDNLYQNKFPEILKSKNSLYSLSKIIFSLYLFSGILGFVSNWFVHIFGLEKRFTFFQFSHKWHYLTYSNKKINTNHRIGDIYTTYIDIATDDDSLFTGRLHEVVINKDGNIEAYTMFDTKKYYRLVKDEKSQEKIKQIKLLAEKFPNNYSIHTDNENQFIYLKLIKGNLFTIASSRVKNTSLSFLKVSGLYKKIETAINTFINSLLIILAAFSVSYIFWDYNLYEFSTYSRRLIFCISLPISFIGVLLFLSSFFEDRKIVSKYLGQIVMSFFIMILLFIPYLYIFNCVKFGVFFLILIGYLVSLSFWLDYLKKNLLVRIEDKHDV